MAWSVEWAVWIDGENMTSGMTPYLTKISVSDKDGSAGDTCSLEFDDSGGQLKLPSDESSIEIFLQGASAFQGKVDSVRSTGSRGGGRILAFTGKGFDPKGKAKQLQSHHLDGGTLQQFMDKVARNAGLSSIVIDPAFAEITRDYWSANGESLLHVGQKLARELGGTFKIRGDQAVLAKRGQGLSATGAALPTVIGVVGQNVISWNITPLTGRGKFSKTKVRYFDRETASFKEVEVETGIDADATDEVRTAVADKDQAQSIAEARKSEAEREGGQGSVELDLDVTAQAEGTFVMVGARPGVDGQYRISGSTQKADRNGGATTSLEIKQPTGEAGKDERKPGSGKTGSASGEDSPGATGSTTASAAGSDNYLEYNRRYGRTDQN
ncbi:late control D family protein [Rhizobium sp. RU36D]|uniref:phage late control D family protein n=1 Tax=Rhizobium sp. RU36D TaxID=1907415 RepID=UPI0009D7D07B|nr:late control D family protein [Rhizobium sp. RU36D]SMD18054.1 hypothetical protein SAMN05880593_1348 [Rhizobium sp. RU36D]